MNLDIQFLKNFSSEVYVLTSNIIISNFNKTNTVVKNIHNSDLVTEVDLQIEAEIKTLLEKNFPDHEFWSEEMGGELEGEYEAWLRKWYWKY
jgi:fructose-1,6-bisphosphatase/inositol monophosphatase family enzyme